MKTNTLLATITLIMSSSLVLAAGQPQEQAAPQPDAVGSAAMEGHAMQGSCMPMHDSMRTMHSQINEIYQAEDPDQRAALIEAHLNSMITMMEMTKGMMDHGMDMPAGD